MTTINLAKKSYYLHEPCLGDLQKVITAYHALATCAHAQQITHLKTLLALLCPKKPLAWRWRVTRSEWLDFLLAVPVVCSLETTKTPSKNTSSDTATDWGALYASICANTNWTWATVDNELRLSQVKQLNEQWQQHPPAHLLVAAYLGYEGKKQNNPDSFFDKYWAMVKGKRV